MVTQPFLSFLPNNMKLSVALATYNEAANIKAVLKSVESIADEVVIVDGSSTDQTVEMAIEMGAKVTVLPNQKIFHINKQKAIDLCGNEWILQLDADEIVSPKLADEIKLLIQKSPEEISEYQEKLSNKKLFNRHTKVLTTRDGQIGQDSGEFVAFFIPRLNYFLGKYLRYGGVYPDGVIRLIRQGRAYLPAKSVHEQMVVEGRVGWLQNDLLHMADPTFSRYLARNSRYIDLIVDELAKSKTAKNLFVGLNYFIIKPLVWFFMTQIRHKGLLDGWQGIVFSFFSALRFPRAYWRYLTR